jgi:hypothetical protein
MLSSIENEKLLTQAQKGMRVYDLNQEFLGTVMDVFVGKAEEFNPSLVEMPVGGGGQPVGSVIGGAGSASDFENEFPKHVRSALSRQGCLKVRGGGIFGPVWYVTPEQIGTIANDQINLNVPGREVIRSR